MFCRDSVKLTPCNILRKAKQRTRTVRSTAGYLPLVSPSRPSTFGAPHAWPLPPSPPASSPMPHICLVGVRASSCPPAGLAHTSAPVLHPLVVMPVPFAFVGHAVPIGLLYGSVQLAVMLLLLSTLSSLCQLSFSCCCQT